MTLPSDKELERLRLGPAQLAAHEAPLAPRTLMDRVMTALRQEESGAAVEAGPMTIPERATRYGVSVRLRTVALAVVAAAALILIIATRSNKTFRVGEIERREPVQQASRGAPGGEPKEQANRIVWALFKDATGLVDNTRVQIAGRRVGAVIKRELPTEYPNRVKITIQIDDKSAVIWDDAIVVKKGASASAEFYLELDPGHLETFDNKGKKIEHRRLQDGDQIRVRDEAPPARDTNLPEEATRAQDEADRAAVDKLRADPISARIAASAQLCEYKNDRQQTIQGIRELVTRKKYSQLGGVEYMNTVSDMKRDVRQADKDIAAWTSRMKALRLAALPCSHPKVWKLTACISADRVCDEEMRIFSLLLRRMTGSD